MMHRPGNRRLVLLLVAAAVVLGGCNLVTGAGDLRAVDGDPAPLGPVDGTGAGPGQGGSDDPGTTSSPAGGSGGAPATGGSPSTGGSPPDPGPLAYADGVAITDLDLYQAVRRPLVAAGQPASSDVPIVASRNGMLRIFYTTDGAYNGGPVTARLTVGAQAPVEIIQTIGGASSQANLGSTINLDVPGALVQPGALFKVELLQPSANTSGTNAAAAYPSTGDQAPLGAVPGGVKLKIKLVPVDNGSLPDTSPAQLDRYQRWFSETYPIPEVEITVRSQVHPFGGYLGSYAGWSQLLDQISDLRYQDGAPDDVYYYGIHDSDGNGLLGLGWVGGPNDVWARAAIGVGWTGETAAETAIHEVGHNHGRDHAPCGVSGDPYYPHYGASIGVLGYCPSSQQLLDPNQYVDFMSYCEPMWISDYTFKALFERVKIVSTQPMMAVPTVDQDRTYDRIRILHGQASWTSSITLRAPPGGTARPIEIARVSDRGVQAPEHATGHFFAYDHLPGGVLFIRRPRDGHAEAPTRWVRFSANGQTFTLSR